MFVSPGLHSHPSPLAARGRRRRNSAVARERRAALTRRIEQVIVPVAEFALIIGWGYFLLVWVPILFGGQ